MFSKNSKGEEATVLLAETRVSSSCSRVSGSGHPSDCDWTMPPLRSSLSFCLAPMTFLNCHPVSNLTCSFQHISSCLSPPSPLLFLPISHLLASSQHLTDPFLTGLYLNPGKSHDYHLVKVSLLFLGYFLTNHHLNCVSSAIITPFIHS